MGSCSVARSALQIGAGGEREARARSLGAWAGARRSHAVVVAAAVGSRPDATRFSRCSPIGTSATSMTPATSWLPLRQLLAASMAAIDHTGTHAHLRGRPCLSYLAGSSFCRAFSRGLSLVSTGRPSSALCSSKHLRHALMSSWHHLREGRARPSERSVRVRACRGFEARGPLLLVVPRGEAPLHLHVEGVAQALLRHGILRHPGTPAGALVHEGALLSL